MANCQFCTLNENCPGLSDCIHHSEKYSQTTALDLSEVKKIAVLCGLFVGENISGIALVVKKDEHGYHNHITLEELQSFAKSIYAMGAAEQKLKCERNCNGKSI